MAYGKMNTPVHIITTEPGKDAEGFAVKGDIVLATIRAYKEIRSTSAKWEKIIGSAAFAKVTAIFRFRIIPGLTVTTSHFLSDGEGRYNIVSAEDVRGRGMYVEVLAERLEGSVM
jgi:head-tail adaptor